MGLWSWIKSFFVKEKPKEDNPIISLVLLLREPRYLDDRILAQLASDAWGKTVGTDDSAGNDGFVVGESLLYILRLGDLTFLINNYPRAYFEEVEDVVREVPDMRLAQAIADHQAWLSVDMIGEAKGESLATAYRLIGKLIVALADNECLAIAAPATGAINVYDEALDEQLRGPDPLQIFAAPTHVPVVGVPEDDPRMLAAMKEAHERWPEFVAAFEDKQGQSFNVKSRFREGDQVEWMWSRVTAIENNVIYGVLDNDPMNMKKIRAGSRVRIAQADVGDWIVATDSDMKGGFTIKVVADSARQKRSN